MKNVISRIRYQNGLDEESIKKQVKHTTRKELKIAVEEINQQFEQEIYMIRLEHNKMKDEIAKKNREIMLLSKYMTDQETMISQNRLFSVFHNDPEDISTKTVEKKNLLKDLGVVKVQIEAMKEAIVEYTNKTFQAAEKIKDLDNEIAMIRSRNHEEMKEL